MEVVVAKNWEGYELIDSGDGLRLERFAKYLSIRPDPNVLWPKTHPEHPGWQNADLIFVGGDEKWRLSKPQLADGWELTWRELQMQLRPTPFRHLGVFPEQSVQWQWIQEVVRNRKGEVSAINLFAYTGASTIVARQAGADVTHVDASKGSVYWASENAELSGIGKEGARWIVDDALKFAKREVKRGKRYDLIIMDPPVFGRGPKGEIWRLEDDLDELLATTAQLFSRKPLGVLINFYATDLYPTSVLRLAEHHLGKLFPNLSLHSLTLEESLSKKQLETGFFVRS